MYIHFIGDTVVISQTTKTILATHENGVTTYDACSIILEIIDLDDI